MNITLLGKYSLCFKSFYFQLCSSYEFAILALLVLHRGGAAIQSRASQAWRVPWPHLRCVVWTAAEILSTFTAGMSAIPFGHLQSSSAVAGVFSREHEIRGLVLST